jgi:thiol-disulfide isomerase/thioredoxin
VPEPGDVPRYRLASGDELVYEGGDQFKFKNGTFDTHTTLHVWVTRKNPDGSVRLVLSEASTSRDSRAPASKEDKEPRTVWAWCDIAPDGQIAPNPTIGIMVKPATYFPLLPPSAADAQGKWSKTEPINQGRTDYAAQPSADASQFVFTADPHDLFEKIYGIAHHWTVHVDRKRGIPVQFDEQYQQEYGFTGKGTVSMKLAAASKKDPAWTKQFGEEMDASFAAMARADEIEESSGDDPKNFDASFDAEKRVLTDALASATLPEVRKQLEQRIADMDKDRKDSAEQAATRAAVLAAPAAQWQANDLAGESHALADYRGKVVVLDFWYRGCGWCIRSMPQLIDLSNRYKDKPVVLLGMNTDRKLEDAKFVVDAMNIPYPALQAREIAPAYKVDSFGFPTLIVLDQTGVVRMLHIGYDPNLGEKLSKKIDELLAAK